MHILNEKHVCGKADGKNFVSAVRPEKLRNEANFWNDRYACPMGFKACMLPDNTIQAEDGRISMSAIEATNVTCIPENASVDNFCPVTDIQFVLKSDQQQIDYLDELGYVRRDFDESYNLFFSKYKLQNPVTTLKIGPRPCENPND